MSVVNWHLIAESDRERIRCSAVDAKLDMCERPTFACQHIEWNTGNTTGISFFYLCEEHAREQGWSGNGPVGAVESNSQPLGVS